MVLDFGSALPLPWLVSIIGTRLVSVGGVRLWQVAAHTRSHTLHARTSPALCHCLAQAKRLADGLVVVVAVPEL